MTGRGGLGFGGPLPCLKASSGSADYEAYLASIPGALLADVYEKYGTRLLELNVRAFLGLRGRKSVNAGLRTTIRELPHRFLAHNNGIVATVDAMEVEDHGNGQFGIKSVRGLQIVNGGQTTASTKFSRARPKLLTCSSAGDSTGARAIGISRDSRASAAFLSSAPSMMALHLLNQGRLRRDVMADDFPVAVLAGDHPGDLER
ncbi:MULTISPECIES: AIPR family protein [unclassified Bradyrhizobium]